MNLFMETETDSFHLENELLITRVAEGAGGQLEIWG